ncbi:hypothetical protein R83H12_02638 [Fibrobacteria bacterium R8-3-H12]
MKTTRRFLLAAISIAITFTFSCSSDKDDGGDGSFNENLQIYNEDGSLLRVAELLK